MRMIKVGTKVKVKSNIEEGIYNGLLFNSDMLEFRGQELTIKECIDFHGTLRFRVEENTWFWNLDFIEEVGEEFMEEERFYCDDCGEEVESQDDLIYVESEDRYVCQSCYDDNYYTCEDCGEVVSRDNIHWVGSYDDRGVCDSCIDDYLYCDDCGHYYPSDEVEYHEEDDAYYCYDCAENHRGRIYSYHAFNDWQFYKTDSEEEPPFYIGHELEVENPRGDRGCVDYLYDNLNVVCMHDGSLDTGYEIISHPQSFNYIMERKEDYKKAFEELINNGYKSHETDTCGLHFHVSRPFYNRIRDLENNWSRTEEETKELEDLRAKQNDIIDRIILVMETYKEELVQFSRRNPSQLTRWAKFMSDYDTTPSGGIKSLYYIKKHKDTCNRYQALNLTNRATIEFRIFRGTLKYETFMASIELVNNIVKQCSDLSIPITDINWKTITEGEFAPQYCIDRGIETDKVIVDNSEEEIDNEKKIMEYTKTISRDILKLYNGELKRLSKNTIRTTTNANEAQEKLGDMYSRVNAFRDFVEGLQSIMGILNSQEINIDKLKYRLKELLTGDYTYRIVDWSLYTEIKEKLQAYVNA